MNDCGIREGERRETGETEREGRGRGGERGRVSNFVRVGGEVGDKREREVRAKRRERKVN